VTQSAGTAWKAAQGRLSPLELVLRLGGCPRTAEVYGQLRRGVIFKAQGTAVRATADVNRRALAEAADELERARQGAPDVIGGW
jgi:hypothetical protein